MNPLGRYIVSWLVTIRVVGRGDIEHSPSSPQLPYICCSGSGSGLSAFHLLLSSRFLLRLYLRTRLHKLEGQAAHLLGDEELLLRLGPLEQQYTQVGFKESSGCKHFSLDC